MRVFLFLSREGDSLPIAQRVMEEGHRVLFYINSPDRRRIGEGLVEKSPVKDMVVSKSGKIDASIIKYILYPKPDCVVFDGAGEGFGKLADMIRALGYPVIGSTQWGNQLEMDRGYSNKMMMMQGINTLAEKVDGVEVSSEILFNGKDVLGVNHSIECKTLMEGGIGPQVGCMGDVVWIGTQGSRLYEEGVGRMIPILKKLKYRGSLSLTTLVTKDRVYGVKFSGRFRYNTFFTLLELYGGKINDLLYGIATGVIKILTFKDGWAVSVTICLQPYPLPMCSGLSKDTPIHGVNKNNLRHIWFYDVYKKEGKYLCSGNGGRLGAITARSLKGHTKDEYTVREAKRRAYRTLSNLRIADVMYRRDIGLTVERDYGQLKEWGYL